MSFICTTAQKDLNMVSKNIKVDSNEHGKSSGHSPPGLLMHSPENDVDWVAVDFGNSKISVSYFHNQQYQVFRLEDKTTYMPAFVTLKGNEMFVGNGAKNTEGQRKTNITMFDFRRIISFKKFDINEKREKLADALYFQNETFRFPLLRAISIIFHSIKKKIETEFRCNLKKAVLTFPTAFDQSQRQLIVDAAKIAGFQIPSIINEPTAAAIAYYAGSAKCEAPKTICVLDFGSGKLDISLLKIHQGKIELLKSLCDLQLGGGDFDKCLITHVCEQIKLRYPQMEIQSKLKTIIREKCIWAKESLSNRNEINIEIDVGEEDICLIISRKLFDALCEHLFKRFYDLTSKMAMQAKETISEVMVIGGSTRIPRIQQDIQQIFSPAFINKVFNPDETVAKGAAIYAASIFGFIKKLNVHDTLPAGNDVFQNAKLQYFVDENGDVLRKLIELPLHSSTTNSYLDKEVTQLKAMFEINQSTSQRLEILDKHSTFIKKVQNLINRAKDPMFEEFCKKNFQPIVAKNFVENDFDKLFDESINRNDILKNISELDKYIPQVELCLNAIQIYHKCVTSEYSTLSHVETSDLKNRVKKLCASTEGKNSENLKIYENYFAWFDYFWNFKNEIRDLEKTEIHNVEALQKLKNISDKMKLCLDNFNNQPCYFEKEKYDNAIMKEKNLLYIKPKIKTTLTFAQLET